MKPTSLKIKNTTILALPALIAIISGILFNNYQQSQHDDLTKSYTKMLQYVLPSLIKDNQQQNLANPLKHLNYKIRDYVYNLKIFSPNITVVVIDPISKDVVSNLSSKYTESRVLGEQFLTEHPKLIPLPVEYTPPNNLGQSIVVGQVYVKDVEYSPDKAAFILPVLIFASLVSLLLSFKIHQLRQEEKRLETENELLKTKHELLKTITFNTAFEHIIEQDFTSVIANRLQQLDSILKSILQRINSDMSNIIHDIYKAPLLGKGESNRSTITEAIISLQSQERSHADKLIEFIKEADQTIKTLEWVIGDLRGTTRLDSEAILVREQVEYFQKHLPPTVQEWDLKFNYGEEPLWINCNPWHLRSIIKNAMYNSSAALKKYRRKLRDKSFEGRISVTCKRGDDETAIVEIEDNGPGIPEKILTTLYQQPQRVNPSGGEMQGNGSMIIFAYLALHEGKPKIENIIDTGQKDDSKDKPPIKGAKVSFIFPLINHQRSKE
ncbi:MAG: hypothetical protein N5P05_001315 [Chroococcopsis gigantea SAG 12.99]|jgi:signal transduction histidine kinase|nr:HAMP domain-containing histidine kinase [Chlorogloea purpurea SAG 13.99]MDV2999709.1 hypothetical protein [Chroococcopsis gigantea SAG 12.99]